MSIHTIDDFRYKIKIKQQKQNYEFPRNFKKKWMSFYNLPMKHAAHGPTTRSLEEPMATPPAKVAFLK